MHRLKVIVIEDEFFVANHLADLIGSLGFKVEGIYHSGEEFLRKTDWGFDAAVVDIFLSAEMSGLQVAEHLKAHQKPFVFLTANQDTRTLKDAARLNPVAYISKPFKTNDVTAALEIISVRQPKMLEIRGVNGVELLNPHEIIFIKSDSVYVELHTGRGMIVQRKLLKEIADELPDSFIRVHRSYLVNLDYIDHRTATHLTLRGHVVPISRSFRDHIEI